MSEVVLSYIRGDGPPANWQLYVGPSHALKFRPALRGQQAELKHATENRVQPLECEPNLPNLHFGKHTFALMFLSRGKECDMGPPRGLDSPPTGSFWEPL